MRMSVYITAYREVKYVVDMDTYRQREIVYDSRHREVARVMQR